MSRADVLLLIYLIYKRLRPAVGTSLAFILMYAALTHNISYPLLSIAIGFMLIHLFGDCFNDYYDVEEDKRNNRHEKLILSGAISSGNLYILSIVFLAVGLILVIFSDILMLLPAMWYTLLLYAYSHPSIRLKKYNLKAYLLGGSVWILTFFLLERQLSGAISNFGMIFALFSFSQFVFILCQKDTTDRNDTTNLFLFQGWRKSFLITAFFGALSSFSLLLLSMTYTLFIFLWGLNFSTKLSLLNRVRQGTITRSSRRRIVLVEFMTPYLFMLGSFL